MRKTTTDPRDLAAVRVRLSDLSGMARLVAEAKLQHSTEYRCIRSGVPTIVTK